MSQSLVAIVLLGALSVLLVVAMVTDWRSRDIANGLNATIALAAPLWWWASGYALWPDVGLQILMAGVTLLVFAAFFALGAMGGGDVKLIAALALWFPFDEFISLLTAMALLGGILTIAMLIRQRMLKLSGRPEIPYGIAIATAGLCTILPTIS